MPKSRSLYKSRLFKGSCQVCSHLQKYVTCLLCKELNSCHLWYCQWLASVIVSWHLEFMILWWFYLKLATFCRTCIHTCLKDQYVNRLTDVWIMMADHIKKGSTSPSLIQQPYTSMQQSNSSLPPLDQPEWACPTVEANRGVSNLNPLHTLTQHH